MLVLIILHLDDVSTKDIKDLMTCILELVLCSGGRQAVSCQPNQSIRKYCNALSNEYNSVCRPHSLCIMNVDLSASVSTRLICREGVRRNDRQAPGSDPIADSGRLVHG